MLVSFLFNLTNIVLFKSYHMELKGQPTHFNVPCVYIWPLPSYDSTVALHAYFTMYTFYMYTCIRYFKTRISRNTHLTTFRECGYTAF